MMRRERGKRLEICDKGWNSEIDSTRACASCSTVSLSLSLSTGCSVQRRRCLGLGEECRRAAKQVQQDHREDERY